MTQGYLPMLKRYAAIAICLAVAAITPAVCAQQQPSKLGASAVPPPGAPPTRGDRGPLQALTGFWIEGPGYDITYGGTYETCAQRCVATSRCVMVEYYRPEKKCNLYDTERPRKQGGSSIVGMRQSAIGRVQ